MPHSISKWPAKLLSHSLCPGYKCGLRKKKWTKEALFNVRSPVSWPTVLTMSPTWINFTLLSFCLVSGNSFLAHAWTTSRMTDWSITLVLKREWGHGISNWGVGLREEPFHSSTVIQGKCRQGRDALRLVDVLAGGCEILFRASPVAWMKIQNRITFNKGCIFFQGKRKKGSGVHGRML